MDASTAALLNVEEIYTTHDVEHANRLLGNGWRLIGHAAHHGCAPDFHLARIPKRDAHRAFTEIRTLLERALLELRAVSSEAAL